ncbi:hypothetical protein D9M73_197870 [compost metagenome]
MQFPAPGLHQHFENTRRPAEIAVNLEGRMRVKHIGISALRAEQTLQHRVSVIALAHARPQAHAPCGCPAGRQIAALAQADLGRLDQRRRVADVDLSARIHRIKVRNVPMVWIGGVRIPILEPLLQLSPRADTIGRNARTDLFEHG